MFTPASARLDPVAQDTLGTLADVLVDVPNLLRVEGHTDNLPIANAQYPSNWELSAARAASVVHLFAANGIARCCCWASGGAFAAMSCAAYRWSTSRRWPALA